MSNYKPYSREWHRQRFLKEALDSYLDDNAGNEILIGDILYVLACRSESCYAGFQKVNQLEHMISNISIQKAEE